MKKALNKIFVLVVPFILLIVGIIKNEQVSYLTFNAQFDDKIQQISIIDSMNSLNRYADMNIYKSDANILFNEDFFNDNVIIALYLSEPSEDITHEVISLKKRGNNVIVKLKRHIPQRLSGTKGGKLYFITTNRSFIPGTDNYEIKFT